MLTTERGGDRFTAEPWDNSQVKNGAYQYYWRLDWIKFSDRDKREKDIRKEHFAVLKSVIAQDAFNYASDKFRLSSHMSEAKEKEYHALEKKKNDADNKKLKSALSSKKRPRSASISRSCELSVQERAERRSLIHT